MIIIIVVASAANYVMLMMTTTMMMSWSMVCDVPVGEHRMSIEEQARYLEVSMRFGGAPDMTKSTTFSENFIRKLSLPHYGIAHLTDVVVVIEMNIVTRVLVANIVQRG